MKETKETAKQRSQTLEELRSKEQVLVFSHLLRREIDTACRQLDNEEGQNNLTIIKEAKVWLNK